LQIGPNAEPGDRDDAACRRGQLSSVDAKGDAAHHRVGYTGLVPHEAGESEKKKQQSGTHEERNEDLPSTEAKGEESKCETVIAQRMYVVGPESEDAICCPAPPLSSARSEVRIVETRADPVGGQLFLARPQPLGCGLIRSLGFPHSAHYANPKARSWDTKLVAQRRDGES